MHNPASIKHYMTNSLITLTAEMDITDASSLLVKHGISGAPVIDMRGNLIGILTEKDCFKVTLNASYYAEPGGKVSEYMSCDVITVTTDLSIFELAQKFIEHQYHRYPVVLGEKLIGIISRRDILRALLDINSGK